MFKRDSRPFSPNKLTPLPPAECNSILRAGGSLLTGLVSQNGRGYVASSLPTQAQVHPSQRQGRPPPPKGALAEGTPPPKRVRAAET